MKILVADDDGDLVDLVQHTLRRDGYTVVTAFDGQSTLNRFRAEQPDLVILDLVMAPIDGMEVLQKVREETDVPILILSGLRDEDHIVKALYKGADDYMVKPFGPRELRGRTKALLRRTVERLVKPNKSSSPICLGDIQLNVQAREVYVTGQPVHLSRIEFDLLKMLMVNADVVVSYDDLLSGVWGYDGEQDYQVVKVTISRLRKKIEAHPNSIRYIQSVSGVGYRFQSLLRDRQE